MRELNLLMVVTLIGLLFWLAAETKQVSKITFIPDYLLETSQPIDGRIDVEYIVNIRPADE